MLSAPFSGSSLILRIADLTFSSASSAFSSFLTSVVSAVFAPSSVFVGLVASPPQAPNRNIAKQIVKIKLNFWSFCAEACLDYSHDIAPMYGRGGCDRLIDRLPIPAAKSVVPCAMPDDINMSTAGPKVGQGPVARPAPRVERWSLWRLLGWAVFPLVMLVSAAIATSSRG